MLALAMALEHLIAHPRDDELPIIICTDSQSALAALREGPSAQRTEPGAEVWNRLLEIAAPARPVTLQWVPSHCGIPGIEAADTLAGEARARKRRPVRQRLIQGCSPTSQGPRGPRQTHLPRPDAQSDHRLVPRANGNTSTTADLQHGPAVSRGRAPDPDRQMERFKPVPTLHQPEPDSRLRPVPGPAVRGDTMPAMQRGGGHPPARTACVPGPDGRQTPSPSSWEHSPDT